MHAFWWLDAPKRLSTSARRVIADDKNVVDLSAVVIWEIAIKKALGKLDGGAPDELKDPREMK